MVKKAIVLHSVVPVRAQAKETAGQETQLLFAQTCSIMEEKPHWTKIHNDMDGQEGWVDSKMITPLSEQEWQQVSKAKYEAKVKMPMVYAMSGNNGQTIPLSMGTCLPNYKEGQFELLGVGFRIDPSMVAEKPLQMNEENLLQVIRFLLNTPYLWGGKNAMGMDCSGFVQVVLSLFARALPRNASEQSKQGRQVKSLALSQPGDLAFFDHEDGKISHVGILLDKDRVVHCSGRVKVERIDDSGILSMENGNTYTHHLVQIRRI